MPPSIAGVASLQQLHPLSSHCLPSLQHVRASDSIRQAAYDVSEHLTCHPYCTHSSKLCTVHREDVLRRSLHICESLHTLQGPDPAVASGHKSLSAVVAGVLVICTLDSSSLVTNHFRQTPTSTALSLCRILRILLAFYSHVPFMAHISNTRNIFVNLVY
jgi:hypothetical protein